jgi:expansin (peptidoglycan-binding protein)
MGRRRLVAALIAVAAVVGAVGIAAAVQHRNATAVVTLSFAAPETGVTQATEVSAAPTPATASTSTSKPAAAPIIATAARPKPSATHSTKIGKPAISPKPKATHTTAPSTSGSSGQIQYGHTYTGRGTFYAATGAGNCSYDASSDLMVGAMNQQDYENSQACGAYLAVTGPTGKTITIKVVDRCPECPPGAIDLSKEAFTKLAPASTGQITIKWKLLSPALSSPVSYNYKSGSSKYWCGIQVRNHRNPVRSLALKVGSSWKNIPRLDYNYFVSANGSGCGSAIRITDIYGHQLTDTGIGISPDVVQRGHAQFGSPS